MLSAQDHHHTEDSESTVENQTTRIFKLYRSYKGAVKELFNNWAFVEVVFEFNPQTIRTAKIFGFKKEHFFDLTNVDRFCLEIIPGSLMKSVYEYSFDDIVDFLENMSQYKKIELSFFSQNCVKKVMYLNKYDTCASVTVRDYDVIAVKFISY